MNDYMVDPLPRPAAKDKTARIKLFDPGSNRTALS